LVTRAIENAQTKVEGHNFDIRKHVLQYDEVVNEQRNRIYEQRRRILTEPSLKNSVESMIDDEVTALVSGFLSGEHPEEWPLDELGQALGGLFHMPPDFDPTYWRGLSSDTIEEQAVAMALDAYAAKEAEISEPTMRQAEKQIMLWAVDNRWIRHLTDLDRLREGIGLQAFAQVDPLVAYKREAFSMYSELMNDIRGDIVKSIYTIQVQKQAPVAPPVTPIARNIRTNRDAAPAAQTMRKSGPELGRNDPCWCGSGKKYKNCHMASDRARAGGQQVPAR
jgi:preprotein translocase subunit SecA